MNRSPEHLRFPEVPHPVRAPETSPDPQVLRERAVLLKRRREKMLLSLRGHISEPLYNALEKKLSYENNSLVSIIDTDVRAAQTHQQLNRTLRSEYFIQKRIDDTV